MTTQRQASTSTRWTEEEWTRIHIHGLNSYGVLYGHTLGQLQARPPITYCVLTNWKVLLLAELNGEIEVTEEDESYITGGFDVEACEAVLDKVHTFHPSTRRVWVNTLTLPAKTKFDMKIESQPEDPYRPYRGWEKDFGTSVKFNNDPSSLGYNSDQRLLVGSEAITRTISPADVVFMEKEQAKRQQGPIKNLVLAVDAQSAVPALLTHKPRLSRDSTILFTQKGMGIMEMVNKEVFPDPKTRPTYIPAIFSHTVWQFDEQDTIPDRTPGVTVDSSFDVYSHEVNQQISGARADQALESSLSVQHGSQGSLLLGPVAIVEGETREQGDARQRSANYLVSAILAAKSLRARCESADRILFYRLRDVAINSVVGPMTLRYNCYNGGIVADEERRAHAKSRLREAASVIQKFCPGLTYEHLEQCLGEHLFQTKDRLHTMFKNVVSGRLSNIEVCCICFSS